MAVTVVGDFDVDRTEQALIKLFGPVTHQPGAPERPLYPVPDHQQTLVAVAKDKEMPSTSVGLYYKLPRRGTLTQDRLPPLRGRGHLPRHDERPAGRAEPRRRSAVPGRRLRHPAAGAGEGRVHAAGRHQAGRRGPRPGGADPRGGAGGSPRLHPGRAGPGQDRSAARPGAGRARAGQDALGPLRRRDGAPLPAPGGHARHRRRAGADQGVPARRRPDRDEPAGLGVDQRAQPGDRRAGAGGGARPAAGRAAVAVRAGAEAGHPRLRGPGDRRGRCWAACRPGKPVKRTRELAGDRGHRVAAGQRRAGGAEADRLQERRDPDDRAFARRPLAGVREGLPLGAVRRRRGRAPAASAASGRPSCARP